MKSNKVILYELDELDGKYAFKNTIVDAMNEAESELTALNEHLSETLETINKITSQCDKWDYILSASSGALCGLLDVF